MRRWWNYIKAWFSGKAKSAADPAVEIEAAITEAQARDRELRTEAAKVIAHRTTVASSLEDAAEEMAKAKELAKQALLKTDEATRAGDAAAVERWSRSAQTLAMRLQAATANVDTLKGQLGIAEEQAKQAQEAVNQNAMRLEEISAKRLEMLGRLQAAKMQETLNKTMEGLRSKVGGDAPSFDEIESKIDKRMAEASAKAELEAASPEGTMAELEEAVSASQAQATLDGLRAELGLGPAPELPPAGGETPKAG